MHVSIDQAEAAIRAAREKAFTLDTQMCIPVVNSGGNLKWFYQMDDDWVGSMDIAEKKPRTAVFFGMKTSQFGQFSQLGGPLFGIEHSNNGLIIFAGGIPIVDADWAMPGAIGVSGSTVENDEVVGEAGVRAIGDTELPAYPWRT